MATSTLSREERIEAQLKTLPAKPGVYLFRGGNDAVLYVGFGGPEGLATYLGRERFQVLLDATHAFAAQISRNAARVAFAPLCASGGAGGHTAK